MIPDILLATGSGFVAGFLVARILRLVDLYRQHRSRSTPMIMYNPSSLTSDQRAALERALQEQFKSGANLDEVKIWNASENA